MAIGCWTKAIREIRADPWRIKIIRADSCIFEVGMVPLGANNRFNSVHVFRVFVSVCDIFRVKYVLKESEKELFCGLIQLKRGKMSVK